jgi:hypothetical protein
MELNQVDMLGLAFGAIGVIAFVWAINYRLHSDRAERRSNDEQNARDHEQRIRDLAEEHRADGSWAGYVHDPAGHWIASSAVRSVPTRVALSDPDPMRRWFRNHPWRRRQR